MLNGKKYDQYSPVVFTMKRTTSSKKKKSVQQEYVASENTLTKKKSPTWVAGWI